MRSEALVGVVIPVWNGERYLAEAIESVLDQTHSALDVVVVDDGSVDATPDVANGYAPRVRLIRRPREGLGATRNAGVDAVRGTYVAFLDHDDLWPPNKIERQLAAFDTREPPDLVFGHVQEFVSPELEDASLAVRCTTELRPATVAGAMLASRAAVDRVGPVPTQWVSADFLAWLVAARRLGLREAMLPDHVLSRRIHDDNMSLREADLTRGEYVRILGESVRGRAASRHVNSSS
jgi:glycosyltransferase involved in cell wall biosynthesis